MLSYNNIDFMVNGTGILTDSVSIVLSNSLRPIYGLGCRNPVFSFDDLVKNEVKISYIPNFLSEPIFAIAQELLNLTGDYSAKEIGFAGIIGSYYLDSFSIKAQPNRPLENTATFLSFWPVTGEFTKSAGQSYQKNKDYIPYGWTTFVMSETGALTYDLDYNIKFDWRPIYSFGGQYPSQVVLMGGTETLTMTREQIKIPVFSGDFSSTLFNSTGAFIVKNLAVEWGGSESSFVVALNGAKITSSEISAQNEGEIRNQIKSIKNF